MWPALHEHSQQLDPKQPLTLCGRPPAVPCAAVACWRQNTPCEAPIPCQAESAPTTATILLTGLLRPTGQQQHTRQQQGTACALLAMSPVGISAWRTYHRLCWRTYHRLLSEAGALSAGASVQKVCVTVSFLCLQFISLGCLLGVAVAQETWPRVRSGSPEYHTAMTRCRLAQRGAAVFCPAGQAPQQIAAVVACRLSIVAQLLGELTTQSLCAALHPLC